MLGNIFYYEKVIEMYYRIYSQECRFLLDYEVHLIWTPANLTYFDHILIPLGVTMAKVYKVADPLLPGTSTQGLETEWSKCILCQEDTSEVLHCPAESKRGTQGAGYKTIDVLLEGFDKIGCLPSSMNISRLDDGNGIEETL